MHINKESQDPHTISSYSDKSIMISQKIYTQSIIISTTTLINPWHITHILDITSLDITQMLALNPEIIILGHLQLNLAFPLELRQILAQQKVGIECMSIGAASRTFNVLLSEKRRVVAAMIFPQER